jgi:hypothetical protein
MKIINLVLILVLLSVSATAEIQQFTKNIDLSINSNILKINSTGFNYERTLTFYSNDSLSNITSTQTMTWYDNVTCQLNNQFDILNEKINNVTESITSMKQDVSYYDSYASCFADLAGCDKRYNETKVQADLYIACNTNLINQQQETSKAVTANKELEVKEKQCEKDKTDYDGQRWIFGLVGALGVGIWSYMKYVRPTEKKKQEMTNNTSQKIGGMT